MKFPAIQKSKSLADFGCIAEATQHGLNADILCKRTKERLRVPSQTFRSFEMLPLTGYLLSTVRTPMKRENVDVRCAVFEVYGRGKG